MNWTELLRQEMDAAYAGAEGLMELVAAASLPWKPCSGQGWMSVAQLLRHLGSACGQEMNGLVTGDGEPAEGEHGLPAGHVLPSVGTVVEARRLLAADRSLALAALAQAGEKRLNEATPRGPGDDAPVCLGRRYLGAVRHLETHTCELSCYLRLQGWTVEVSRLRGRAVTGTGGAPGT